MPPLAPRPFVQLARRCLSLRLTLPRGYAGAIDGAPWYWRQRRRRGFHLDRAKARQLRRELNELYQRHPDAIYLRCEVA